MFVIVPLILIFLLLSYIWTHENIAIITYSIIYIAIFFILFITFFLYKFIQKDLQQQEKNKIIQEILSLEEKKNKTQDQKIYSMLIDKIKILEKEKNSLG